MSDRVKQRDPTSARLGMIDVETSPITPRLTPRNKFWGIALEGEDYRRFETTEDMRLFLSQRANDRPPLRLYNWHDYEVCQAIADGIIPERMLMRGGRVLRCNVENVPWVNGYALFPTSLAKLLDTYGYKKRPMTAGHEDDCDGSCGPKNKRRPLECPFAHPIGCECPDCETILGERNVSDCVEGLASLLKAGQAYDEAIGFDPVRNDVTTAAKAAMLAAESLAGPVPLFTERREAYRGGRTEAFRLWDCGEVDVWDVKSSYPAAFLDLPEHDRLLHAAVRVPLPAPGVPTPFFREAPREEGLLFPAGEFDTWFFESTYEKYIQPHSPGCVRRVYESIPVDFGWVKKVVPLIKRGYDLKQKGGALAFPAKILLNSLYGRMGIKAESTISYISGTLPQRNNTHFALPGGGYYVFETVPREIRTGANYLFAAAVTDNARGRLYDAMMRTGAALYCDTDSVFVPKGTTGLESGTELGEWERIGSGPLYVRTVKDYEFAGIVKLKGGNRSTTWTVRLALGKKPVRDVRRKRGEDSRYSKRRVLSDGSTLPLTLRE